MSIFTNTFTLTPVKKLSSLLLTRPPALVPLKTFLNCNKNWDDVGIQDTCKQNNHDMGLCLG